MDSILLTIKSMLGLDETYKVFDKELIVYINTAINVLEQLGIGQDGFTVASESDTWDSYVTDLAKMEGIKTYIYIRTRLLFDPPSNSTLSKSLEDTARELEWRLNVKAEHLQNTGTD